MRRSNTEPLPLRINVSQGCGWLGKRRLPLSHQAVHLLQILTAHPGTVIPYARIQEAVWPGQRVPLSTVRSAIRQLRRLLNDNARRPRYLRTLPEDGYQFIGPVIREEASGHTSAGTGRDVPHVMNPMPLEPRPTQSTPLVGREREEAQLQAALARALEGNRQVVFITGEPGIGKTALVTAFHHTLQDWVRNSACPPSSRAQSQLSHLRFATGQCLMPYGDGDPYLPIADIVQQLAQQMERSTFVSWLQQYAPTWLSQHLTLLSITERRQLNPARPSGTSSLMIAELVQVFEQVAIDQPLLLVLEDVQWADPSTLAVIESLARRTTPAQLLLLLTARTAVPTASHERWRSVQRELLLHRCAEEISLDTLTDAAVTAYLTHRFPTWTIPNELTQQLYHRSGGHPLFVTAIVEDWVRRGVLVAEGTQWSMAKGIAELMAPIPETIRQLFVLQAEGLSATEQYILGAASLAGLLFASAEIAAALAMDVSTVEEVCADLVRRQVFVQEAGVWTWPDGTLCARYQFRHALHQQVWHERVAVSLRQRYHQLMGERKEAAYGAMAPEIAVELAVHFEQAQDYTRTVHYLWHAGVNSLHRCAYREALTHLDKGVALLDGVPDLQDRAHRQLLLQLALGAARMITDGYAAPAVAQLYHHAESVGKQWEASADPLPVLGGMWSLHITRAELQTAQQLAKQLHALANHRQAPLYVLAAYQAEGYTAYYTGGFHRAQHLLEQSFVFYDPALLKTFSQYVASTDVQTEGLATIAWSQWMLGYPEQALTTAQEALARARRLDHPLSLVSVLYRIARLHQLRGEVALAFPYAEEMHEVATAQNMPLFVALATIAKGWVLARQGYPVQGIRVMEEALAAYQRTGTLLFRPYFLALLAEVALAMNDPSKGLVWITDAHDIVHQTGEHHYTAELYRLKGELLLQQANGKARGKKRNARTEAARHLVTNRPDTEVERCLLKALEIARTQEAKSLELRATVSLARLWQQRGQTPDARRMLADCYSWFTEGFDTTDLVDAKSVLATLS